MEGRASGDTVFPEPCSSVATTARDDEGSGLWLCVRVPRKSRGLAGQVSSSSLEAPESPEHLEEWVWAKGEDLEEGAERARG